MSLKIKLFTLLLFLFGYTSTQAQSESKAGEKLNYVDTGEFFYIGGGGNQYKTEGSPFLFDEFTIGHLKQGEKITKNLMVKFNILENKVLIVRPFKLDTVYVDKSNLTGFEFSANGKIYNFILLKANQIANTPKTGFFEVLYDGKYKLLKEYIKEIIVGDFEGIYSAEKNPDKIVNRKPKLYIFNADSELYEIKGKGNDLEEIFGYEIKEYVESNNIKLKKKNQIIKLLEYIDSQN